jgi:hypothetical protein
MARTLHLGFLALTALTLLGGCSGKRVLVMVPPDLDLAGYQAVGIVEFSGKEPHLAAEASRQFRDEVLQAQPGVRLVELDGEPEAQALSSARRPDPAALAALRDRFGVDAIFMGDLQVSEVRPNINLSASLISMRASAEAHATLNVRLVQTASGATVWSRSAQDKTTVANMRADSRGSGHIGVADPEAKYAELVAGLTSHVAAPLWPRYIRRKPEDVPPHYVVTYPDGVAVYAPPERAVTAVGETR